MGTYDATKQKEGREEQRKTNWLRLPPTSTILHSVPLSLPAVASISNLYSDTLTVLRRALRTVTWGLTALKRGEGGGGRTIRRDIFERRQALEVVQKAR